MVAQVEFRKILRFRKPTGREGSSRKKFTRCARNTPSLESAMGSGGGVIAEKSSLSAHVVAKPSKKKSVDSSINHFFVDLPSNVLVFYSIHFLRSNISFVEI